MKKVLLTALSAMSIAAAVGAPAVAQPYGPRPGYGAPAAWNIDQRIDWVQHRINVGQRDGSLSPQEKYRVQTQLNVLRRDFHAAVYRDGGRLYNDDRLRLQARLDDISNQIRWLRRNDVVRPW